MQFCAYERDIRMAVAWKSSDIEPSRNTCSPSEISKSPFFIRRVCPLSVKAVSPSVQSVMSRKPNCMGIPSKSLGVTSSSTNKSFPIANERSLQVISASSKLTCLSEWSIENGIYRIYFLKSWYANNTNRTWLCLYRILFLSNLQT